MSLRYKGAVISATPPTTTGGNSGTAPGAWTLQQQLQAQAAGTWPSFVPLYIEDVFSTWLYTGNGSTQTITNGIDLSGQGGLAWIKSRSYADYHRIFDTARGVYNLLDSASTAAQNGNSSSLTAFNADGFSIGASTGVNQNTSTYASWTFREQPKFFDVVTYTGNGAASQTVSHNLGSAPGVIIIKRTDSTSNWFVGHRDDVNAVLYLNTTAARTNITWNSWVFGSTTFRTPSISGSPDVNVNGGTYVAYLFAHDAGGFGLTGTDNVISCGSYTGTGATLQVNLGYEAQWVLIKRADSTGNWRIYDVMRGADLTNAFTLYPNTSGAEVNQGSPQCAPYASGFVLDGTADANTSGGTYIYIAIRRGPMKTPTSGASVFDVQTSSGAAGTQITTAFPIDLVYALVRTAGEHDMLDRLRGISNTSAGSPTLDTTTTDFESSKNVIYNADQNVGFKIGSYFGGISNVFYNFRRAPGFFDEVCYTGTGTAGLSVTHNLGAVPELMIIKDRTVGEDWTIYSQTLATNQALKFTTAAREQLANYWNTTRPTSTVFSVGNYAGVNSSGDKYVAYLFASVAGVSKVGSYTGTGSTQTISCGFAARFVFIKRTDSTGDWWVWDTARGMVAGTDPRLALQNTNAETNANWVYTNASGFQIVTTDATVNASGGTYIYLAIA